jgi:hypothetical protein
MQTLHPPIRRGGVRAHTVVIAVVVVVFVVAAGALGLFLYSTVSRASEAPRDTTEEFVADLAAGDTAAAYAKLCAQSQTQYDEERFAAMVAAQQLPVGVSITGVSMRNGAAEVYTTLELADGTSRPQEFALTKERSGWKVCGRPY